MPTHIHIQYPTHLSTTSGIKFETYRFYLACFRDHLLMEYKDLPGFIAKSPELLASVKSSQSIDPAPIEPHLRIAWNTEFLLSIDHGDPDIVRINNQWATIQAYYAVYSGLEALAYALDGHLPKSHSKAQRKCSDYLINLGISPWDKAFRGAEGKSGSAHKPVNFPSSLAIPHNLQRSGVDPLGMIARCLKAEHSHRIDDKWRNKKESGCFKYQYKPGPTTLLHFLYRLRIKSNYQEIDAFVSQAPQHEILDFAQALQALTSWSLALFEMILMRRLGTQPVKDLAQKYMAANPSAAKLGARLAEYSKVLP